MFLRVTHWVPLALDVVLKVFLGSLELGQLPLPLLNHFILTLQQRIDEVLLVVLLLFLLHDILDFLVYKLYLITEFLRFRIFAFEVPSELGH